MMQAIAAEDLKFQPYPGQRANTSQYMAMFQGKERTPENFELSIVRMGEGGTWSPRHRHTFDQFRLPFNGPYNQSPGADIPQGRISFVPEGAWYGPQDLPAGLEFLILQFGGASGTGYMSHNELMAGTNELKKTGEFVRGVYKRHAMNGQPPERLNQDAYEAVWEHVNGKRIAYAEPRYRDAIVIDQEAFAWAPVAGSPGVSTRLLGVFNERGTSGSQLRLAPKATYTFAPERHRRLMVVLGGTVEHAGKRYAPRSAFNLAPDESAEMRGTQGGDAVLFVMQLPCFD
jgi:hypothetical protein